LDRGTRLQKDGRINRHDHLRHTSLMNAWNASLFWTSV